MRFLALLIFLFLLFPKVAFATRSISITTDKSSLIGDEILTIIASPSGFATDEAILVKGAFYQGGTTTKNYFGYTQKGDAWVKNSQTTTDQLSVKMGEWDNILKIKSDFNDSGYKGEGDYSVLVGFYYVTSTGSNSSVNWSSNTQTVTINEPDPIPTPTPTPTPTSTPTPTATPSPTSTPTSTPTLSPTATITKAVTPSVSPTPLDEFDVLGSSDSASIPDSSPTPSQTTPENQTNSMSPASFFGIAAATIGLLSLAFWRLRKLTKPAKIKP